MAAARAPALLRVDGVGKHFRTRGGLLDAPSADTVKAVDGVSFEIGESETLGLVGESGCGKTTLGRLVLRLVEPTFGRIQFEGRDILAFDREQLREMRRHAQIVFQDPYRSLNPSMSVGDIIAEPLHIHGVARGAAARRRVAELLDMVGLPVAYAARRIDAFSGGQRQRIAIARALSLQPRLIVCDEPTSALDVSIQAQIVNLLKDLQQSLGLSYLFISHDLALVQFMAERVVVMYLGRIVESAPADELFRSPRHPYTQALLSAIPSVDAGAGAGRIILEGGLPSPMAPPTGCHFHPRCRAAREAGITSRCAGESPALVTVGEGHQAACLLAGDQQVASSDSRGTRSRAAMARTDSTKRPSAGEP